MKSREEVESKMRENDKNSFFGYLIYCIMYIVFGLLQGLFLKETVFEDSLWFPVRVVLFYAIYTFFFTYIRLGIREFLFARTRYSGPSTNIITYIIYCLGGCISTYLLRDTGVEFGYYIIIFVAASILNCIILSTFEHNQIAIYPFLKEYSSHKIDEQVKSIKKVAIVGLILSAFS